MNTEELDPNLQPEESQEEQAVSHSFQPSSELAVFSDSIRKVKEEIGKVLVGQEALIDLMIAAVLTRGHVLVEGVPGVAKTLASKLMAKCMEVDYSRIQFTPDLMPSDVLGTNVFIQKKGEFEHVPGPIFSQVVLIDEINRAPAKTQSALFEVMEERQVTMDGVRYPMEEPFFVMATQNPIEQEGTYRLPEAQLDRFLFKIEVGYPTEEEELNMLERFHPQRSNDRLEAIRPILMKEEVIELQNLVLGIEVTQAIQAYVVRIVQKTRNHHDIYLGASPRATLNLLQAAKAFAALRGRGFVTPDDVQKVAGPVLCHRILLMPEKEQEGGTESEVIDLLVKEVEVPR